MVKGVAVWTVQIMIMLFQVSSKAVNQQVFLRLMVNSTNVINRYCSFSHSTYHFCFYKGTLNDSSPVELLMAFMVLFTDWLDSL